MSELAFDQQMEFSIREGAPNAYEVLRLPLWTKDPQRIFCACREQIEEIRESEENGHSPQQQAQIAQLLRAQNVLTSPGARKDYNDQLRTELIERAEREASGTEDEPLSEVEEEAPDASPSTAKTLVLPQFRETAPTLQLPPVDAGSQQQSGESRSPSQAEPKTAQLATAPRESDRGEYSVSPRRRVISALRYIAAVAVTSVAINLAFFSPRAIQETPGRGIATADRTTLLQQSPVIPANAIPASTIPANAVSIANEIAVDSNNRQNRDVVDPGQLPGQFAGGDTPAAGKPRMVEPRLPEAGQANAKEPVEVAAAEFAPVGKLPVVLPIAVAAKPVAPDIHFTVATRPLPDNLSTNEQRQFAKLIRDLLYEGFSSGKEASQRSSNLYRQAESLSTNDPRLHYGYGLVLWKRLRHAEALGKLELAAQTDTSYWPAQQALIRLKLARNHDGEEFDLMAEMVDRLRKRQAADITDDDRHAAYWLGRLMAYLHQPENQVNPPPQRVQIVQTLIERRLNDELLDAFHAGENRLNVEFDGLIALSKQSLEQEIARAAERNAEKLKTLEKKLQLQKDRQENVNRSAREWKELIDKQTSEADEQLKLLTEQYSRIDAEARAYRQAVARLDGRRVNPLQLLTEQMRRRKVIPLPPPPEPNPFKRYYGRQPVPIDSYSATRVHYEAKYNQLDAEASVVRLRAVEVAKRRAQAVQRYQQATGELVDKSDSMRNWEKILAKQKESIKQAQESTGASSKAKSIMRKARALDSYIAFDPVIERQRLLDSLPAE